MPRSGKPSSSIGTKAPYPGFIEPELATSSDIVPSGARWIHETKFDGYSMRDLAPKTVDR
jgi:bifunctional non-homologous end joining protein LigD